MTQKEQLQVFVQCSSRIVFFGGAGMSTESGIPDFRSEDGLYRQHYKISPETIISIDFYNRHAEEFYAFYKDRMLCLSARPNAGHLKLAELERAGKLSAVITQNIDGLHQQAGSQTVIELHGSVHRNYCLSCGRQYDAAYIKGFKKVPKCECGGAIKPDVVLYGEPLDPEAIRQSAALISGADMLIVGGTSLAVYPAAGLIDYYRGGRLVLINRTPTPADARADLVIRDSIGEVLSGIQVA